MSFLRRIQEATIGMVSPLAEPILSASGGTYIYPFKGIKYFIMNPILWANMCQILLPEIVLGIGIFMLFTTFLLPAQTIIALFLNGPIGIITAWIALVHETTVAVKVISSWFLFPEPLRVLFDTVLTKEGFDDLVVKAKLRKIIVPSPWMEFKQKIRHLPKKALWPKWALKATLKLVLHFVPILGPLALVATQGPGQARRSHERYFELKGFDEKQTRRYISDRHGQYVGFGVVAAALEAIPVLGVFFAFTNTVGAALWSVDIEKRQRVDEDLLRKLD